MKRNYKQTNKAQEEKKEQAQSVSVSDSTVEADVVPVSEAFDNTTEKKEAPQPAAPSETKKALLGELRAVLENTKQDAGAAGKENEASETTAQRVQRAIAAETTVEKQKQHAAVGDAAKDIRKAVADASSDSVPEQEPKLDAFSPDSLPQEENRSEAKEAEPFAAMTYESMAEAAETARKESTGRFSRDAVDDDTFLAELYTLIGDGEKTKTEKTQAAGGPQVRKAAAPTTPRPAGRITPEKLQAASEEYQDVLEDDEVGVPGWLKGAFLLLIALLLSAMTFYAVATDLIGKVF